MTKWCPFARAIPVSEKGVIPPGAPSYNRLDIGNKALDIPPSSMCIEHNCAVWVNNPIVTRDGVTGRCGLINR